MEYINCTPQNPSQGFTPGVGVYTETDLIADLSTGLAQAVSFEYLYSVGGSIALDTGPSVSVSVMGNDVNGNPVAPTVVASGAGAGSNPNGASGETLVQLTQAGSYYAQGDANPVSGTLTLPQGGEYQFGFGTIQTQTPAVELATICVTPAITQVLVNGKPTTALPTPSRGQGSAGTRPER